MHRSDDEAILAATIPWSPSTPAVRWPRLAGSAVRNSWVNSDRLLAPQALPRQARPLRFSIVRSRL
jgi:hypothetical protein